MKRRWVFFHVAIAVAIFGLIMQAAHIGSINLWITVSGLAFAVGIVVLWTLNAAGRRLRPWPSRAAHKRASTSSSARTARDRSLGIVLSEKVEQFKRGLSLQRLVVIAPHR
jgi:hypothetical protein